MKLTPLIGAAILGCISIPAFAYFPDKCDNFYIAAYAGIFTADFTNKYLDQTDVIPLNIVQTSMQNGYTGGLALGYTRLISPYYFIGEEFSANINSGNASFQSGASSTVFSDQVTMHSHFDLTLVPGLILSNSISAYLKLGVSYALLEDTLNSPAGFNAEAANYHRNKNVLGFAAGLGVKKSLSKHIFIFTEADFHDYGTLYFSNFQNFMSDYSHSTHVYSYEVVVGAAYTL